MSSLKETATEYCPKRTLNITDLDKVDLSFPMEDRSGIGKPDKENPEGRPFDYKVMVVNEQEYRVPNTVIEEIQKILKLKPDTKFVKVKKTGSDLATRYSVEFVE